MMSLNCRKEFVTLTIVFLTRIATVEMVLWDDTKIVQLWAIQCAWSSYTGTAEYATKAWKFT